MNRLVLSGWHKTNEPLDDRPDEVAISNDSGAVVCTVWPFGIDFDHPDGQGPEQHAVAKLIVAAPRLLTLLKDALDRLEEHIGADCECNNTHEANKTTCCLCQYRSLIAEAEGQTPATPLSDRGPLPASADTPRATDSTSPSSFPMSADCYVEDEGLCPFCGEKWINYAELDEPKCDSCGAHWRIERDVVGYSFKNGDGARIERIDSAKIHGRKILGSLHRLLGEIEYVHETHNVRDSIENSREDLEAARAVIAEAEA